MDENNLTMADLMAEVDLTMKRIRKGDIKKAKVVSVEDSGVVANINYHADALIPWSEYAYEEVSKEDVQIGDEFEVLVLSVDDGDGNVLVSKRRAELETSYENIAKMFANHAQFAVKVKEVVKGGLTTSVQGVRAFIPASQISHTFVDDLTKYVGQTVEVEIIEFDPSKRKLVLSGRAISKAKADEAKAERLAAIVEGEKYTGTITKLMPYGAFVNIGGVEGLVRNADLSWVRIKHPSDVVKEGQQVDVTVLSVEDGKIALRMKDITMDPWYLETANLEKGQILMGKVTKFMNFGAFVAISENVEGLVHISQITDRRISKPDEALELGQEVKVKVVSIDKESKRVSLSINAAQEVVEENIEQYMEEDETSTMGDVLGDTFKNLFN
ncbi:MAG: 30S ribosomal protein S1 [Cellulosilyticaceae bacterium]